MTAARGAAAAMISLLLAVAALGGRGGQGQAAVGFLSKDRIIELATAVDGSVMSFAPSPAALAYLAALVDPVHVRMFLLASRPGDLKPAAAIIGAFEATGNAALSAEFIGVAADLSEPAALIADHGITETPEVIIYWLGVEAGRMRPRPGVAVEEGLADLIHQARSQIAREMLLDNEFFRNTFHSDLPLDCKHCHFSPR